MSTRGLAKKPATYEDLKRVPDHLVAEILDGELHTTPRPALRHARVATVLGADLGNPFDRGRDGPGGWLLLFEPELHLADDILVPDLAGWQRTRLPAVPDAPYLTLAPDWVCEVISPSTERIDRAAKLAIYARERVAHVWLINPATETLEVFALASDRWTLLATHAGPSVVRTEPFDAIELDLSALWPTDQASPDGPP